MSNGIPAPLTVDLGPQGPPGPPGASTPQLFAYAAASAPLAHATITAVDLTGGPATYTLPPLATAAAGGSVGVADLKGQCVAHPATIAVQAGDRIQGNLNGTYVINGPNGIGIRFVPDATRTSWWPVVGL